jgi:hypothetical protein
MSAGRNRKPEYVERLLAEAHRSRQGVVVGEDWTYKVMRTIRRDAAGHSSPSNVAWAEPLVWRVAAGAALVAVLFAGSVVVYTGQRSNPVTALWLEELEAGASFPEE